MSVPLPRTSSCGDTKTVEIIRLPKISVHHQAGEGLVSLQSPCASHVDGAEVSADEEGYLTMRNMQTLLTNSDGHACAAPQDYEQRVVRQQLPLSDAHEGFADGSPFGAYAEITSRQQPTFDEENEYVPMTEKNGQYAISNGSNSEDYETVRFVHEKPRSFKCSETRIQQTPFKHRRLPPIPPPPYRERATTQTTRREIVTASLYVTSRDELIDNRAPVPPPRTKRKCKNALNNKLS
ncbi:hypothetical protein EMCRGX_G024419 [Ephydatia muelleri]|eukprot:Em0015g607a